MTVEDRRKALLDQPCTCVSCADCNGSGQITVDTHGYPDWDFEPCYTCSGGIVEVCDRCVELEELEREDDL